METVRIFGSGANGASSTVEFPSPDLT